MLRGAVHKSFDFSFGFRVDPAPAVGRAPFRTVLARSVWRRHPVQRRGTLAGRAGRAPHRMQCGHEATKKAPGSDHDLHLGTGAYSQDCARAPRPRACGLVSTERRGCVTPIRVTPVCWPRRGKIGHTITGAAGVATIGVRQRLDEPRRAAAAFGARGGAARRAEERSALPSSAAADFSGTPSGRPDQLASAARMRSAVAASSSSAAGRARRKSRSCSPSIGTRCRWA